MKPTPEMLDLAATAILNRRIKPDWNKVNANNVWLVDHDMELSKVALTAALSGVTAVPNKPTQEILDELGDDGYNTEKIKRRYVAMLAAAPRS
jgi:hypothetical protein